MNISKKLLSLMAITSIIYTATTLSMQKTPQRTFQRGAEQANMNYGGFSSYNTPRGVANTFTTLDGKVFSVYNGHIIFTPEMAEAIYPKLDLNKVRFTVENEAFCSNGQNSGPAQ